MHIERKSLEVLDALIASPRDLVPTSEIISFVWPDNPIGITPVHLAQHIRKLRKVFADHEPGVEYIKNIKGSGYIFCFDVEIRDSIRPADAAAVERAEVDLDAVPGGDDPRIRRSFVRSKLFALAGVLIAVLFVSAFGWYWFATNDEEQIRTVIRKSQMYEFMVLYKSPRTFKEQDLDQYWTSEVGEHPNYDRRRIREAVMGMVDDGRYYGDESKCEQFEFQSIEISRDNDQAVVKTFEKWFAAEYLADGTLNKNKYIGPYFVSYVLRKVDGRWLIEKSTTARVNRPIPRLDKLESATPPVAGQQFFINVSGVDFEPETFLIEVIGPGCPEPKPCKVPNSALRDHSKLSANLIERIPLTLASGQFRIVGRNGDSQASNELQLIVP